MLLTNRRHRILYLALAGVDVAWLLPWLALLTARLQQRAPGTSNVLFVLFLQRPVLAFFVLWSLMIVYMFTADVLNRRQVTSPLREVVLIILLISTSLGAIYVYGSSDRQAAFVPGGESQFSAFFRSIYDFTLGVRGEAILTVANVVLWLRVSMATDRDLSFFGVGITFRLAMLIAVLGNTLLTVWTGQPSSLGIAYLAIFFTFGLTAVGLARIDQKAVGAAHSTGAVLPWSRLAQLLAVSLFTVATALGLSALINPATIRTALSIFDPVWTILRWLLVQTVFLTFLLLSPLLERLARFLQGLLADMPETPPPEPMAPGDYVSFATVVREWTALRYCLVTGVILVVVFLIWLFFMKTRPQEREEQEEEVQKDEVGFGGLAALSLDRLRNWLRLLQNYGMSTHLLNALSVENMYANVSRLARRRGYPRKPSQPPDSYLTQLQDAFPERSRPLADLTTAYMRVHYGDMPVSAGELDSLRQVYEEIIAPPADETDSQ